MSVVVVVAVTAAGLAAAGVARLLLPPTPRLGPRVRPYTIDARIALGHAPDVDDLDAADAAARGAGAPLLGDSTVARVFGPMAEAVIGRLARVIESRSDAVLELALHRAGARDVTPDAFRARQTLRAAATSVAAAFVAGLLFTSPIAAVIALVGGFVHGAASARSAVDRAAVDRAERLRLELYTVNQLLALHLRTGAGPIQAIQRIVDRGRGVIVEELDDILNAVRGGMGEADAFRRAASLTAEPAAARTYNLFATAAERGADLAPALRALSNDLRDARREHVRKEAVKRRAAMLVPTIALLAPIMLLFIAAPIPSMVFAS